MADIVTPSAQDTEDDYVYMDGEIGELARICDRVKEVVKQTHTAPLGRLEPFSLSVTQVADLLGRTTSGIRRLDKENVLDLKLIRGDRQRVYYTLDQVQKIRKHFRQIVWRQPSDPPAVVAVNSLKGGSGKSCTTLHLAHRYVLNGYRVLVIDCDPQGTLTTYFGLRPDVDVDREDTLFDVIAGNTATLAHCIRPSHMYGLDYVPASTDMYGAEMVAYSRQRERAKSSHESGWKYYQSLRDAIVSVQDDYDIILIDTPPSLSALTHNALYAASCLLTPMAPTMDELLSVCSYYSLIEEFFSAVRAHEKKSGKVTGNNQPFDWARLVVTRYSSSTAERDVMTYLAKAFGRERILSNFVVHSQEVISAAADRKSLYELSSAIGARKTYIRALTSMNKMAAEALELIHSTWPSHAPTRDLDLWAESDSPALESTDGA